MYQTLLEHLENLDDTNKGLDLLIAANELEGDSSFLNHSGDENGTISLYSAMRKEAFEFFCTSSLKYKDLRSSADKNSRAIVVGFASLATHKFGASASIATSIAAVSLYIPLKISVAAFCQLYRDSPNEPTATETKELKRPQRRRIK